MPQSLALALRFPPSSRPASGGGGGYVADAVHLDGTAYLSIDSLTAAESPYFAVVWWFKTADTKLEATLLVVDPDDTVCPYIDLTNGHMDVEMAADPSPASVEVITTATFNNGAWHCFMAAIDASAGGPFPLAVYVDDVKITAFDTLRNSGSAFQVRGNGLPFQVGYDNTGSAGHYIGDLCDYRVIYGVNLAEADGTITEVNRRLFIDADGKPVDPAIATAALGAAGEILLSGDATGFATNQGTGGAFTLTGALADATTSPSD